MAMNIGAAEGAEDEAISTINTTPLVDVMLVLLIIFLITIPVVTQSIPLQLPQEATRGFHIAHQRAFRDPAVCMPVMAIFLHQG